MLEEGVTQLNTYPTKTVSGGIEKEKNKEQGDGTGSKTKKERELQSTDLHQCPNNPRESLYAREFYTFKQKAIIQGFQSPSAAAPQSYFHPVDRAHSEKNHIINEPNSLKENSKGVC